jgi:hypothetical protein
LALHRDHHRDGREGHVHVDILLFVVVEEMELFGPQAVYVIAVAVHHGHRRHHHVHRLTDHQVPGRLGLGGFLLALREQRGREQPAE